MVKYALSATLHPAIAPAFFDDMNLLRLNSGTATAPSKKNDWEIVRWNLCAFQFLPPPLYLLCFETIQAN
jgi:hypothetical protein